MTAESSEGSKLAALLLHLELNPDELARYQRDPEYMREELTHFGLSQTTIDTVMKGDLAAFGVLFGTLRSHLGVGVVAPQTKSRNQ
jgi:hypothetical protein